MDSGGGTSTASGYTLVGTAGQPGAGAALTGSGFTLVGGFWRDWATHYEVYLPLIVR